ncbi:unnamed protein product [Adineta steineri]|uniref:Reverse transcriptase domain-containing protein n=1 Tax=Adineta steineri TaxID=433720 RepID=A0A815H9Q7_9BILA|nr:unnamed protein product [Adineta steineri]CAF1595937.1 unnamed protein product [Adineta steineri]
MDTNDLNREDIQLSLSNQHEQQEQQEEQQQQQKKKCHGNRKDRRFRKKCRARRIKPAIIEKLLKKRKQVDKKKNDNITNITNDGNSTKPIMSNTVAIEKSDCSNLIPMANLNKRKRDISIQELKPNSVLPKSTGSISIVQRSSKKMMKQKNNSIIKSSMQVINDNMKINYRRPMYLERSSSTLFQMLKKRLNDSLKKKDEKIFIYTRLQLLDPHYCLEIDLQLWRSYLDIGLQQRRWPEQLYLTANTHDFEICHQYLINYIQDIENQMNQYQIKLTEQSQSCPITTLTMDQIDSCLKEFINCQRQYLDKRNNNQLAKFKDNIKEKELFEILTTYSSTLDLNKFIDQLLTKRQKQIEIWKEQLMLETRVICKFLPQNFDQLQNFVSPITYVPLNNEQKIVELKYKHYKIIQEGKRMWLDMFFSIYEINLQQYDEQYQEILIELESLLLTNTTIVDGTTLFDQINQYMTYRTDQLKKEIRDEMSSFRGKLLHHRQCSSITKNMIGVSPEPFLDLISNPFTKREWNYLSLGPSYIRLNQSAIRPVKQQNIQIKNQHKDIYNKVENHLTKNQHMPKTASILTQYSNHLVNHLNQSYFAPICYKDQLQAQEQARIAKSIRNKIKKKQLILRITDKSKIFYIGSKIEYEKKAVKYFSDTNAFAELTNNPFNEILNKVIGLLKTLSSKKFIYQWHEKQMLPDLKKCELSHLYFNPKTHKDGIPVRPIENTIHSPTTNISKFLDQHIRPIFNDKCSTTTIIDGAHLIKQLEIYTRKHLFKSSTLFCTFDIHNLFTMLPQDEALDTLIEFLSTHGYEKVKGISLNIIEKLSSIVLKENVFVYGKKIYKQIIGGAMGSALTLTLANIFMWKWQQKFVDEQNQSGEFFGRYIDDVFITWNRSEEELRKFLDDANTWHPNIKLDYQIGKSLPFLNVLVTNNNGILTTSVYHKPAAEPYVVPYTSDHPRHVFGNIVQTALSQAMRYSSTFDAFHKERRYIKLKLLYNGYPSSIIHKEFQKFFLKYIPTSILPSYLPFVQHEKEFVLMRNQIMGQPTSRQSQVAMNITNANDNNNDHTNQSDTIPTDSISIIQNKKKKPYDENKLIVHYTHEKRFSSTKRDIHRNYTDVFNNTPAMDVKLIVGNRNRRAATNDLIRKKPRKSLLTNKPFQSMYMSKKKHPTEI